MERHIDAEEEQLESVAEQVDEGNYDPIYEWLDHVLEIKRTQSLGSDGWGYTSYEFLVGYGGPTVVIYDDGYVEVTWVDKEIRRELSDMAKKGLEYIYDAISELGYQ